MRSPQYTDHHTHRNNSDRKKDTSKIKSKKSQKQTDVPIDAKVARMIRESSSSLLDLRSPRSSPDDPGIVIRELDSSPGVVERRRYPRQILKSIHNAMFIAQHIDNEDDFDTSELNITTHFSHEPELLAPPQNPMNLKLFLINLDMDQKVSKNNTEPSILRALALEILNILYPKPEWLRIFTD
ncbi:hypothetical protein TNIN_69501 [Trichonephila inaurata madagascariensis]|uniref:Uncharacterized protein n=1 Tax=Trichonephila inaurata madagascariensis TaxID=2747483 RepID=A0A8X6MC10_9ARAC|nr:hypothetical protein TNIN_69501 [Trichonephila inaurata madagascariensis]